MDRLRDDLAAFFPQFGLRVAHAGLMLSPPTDVELLELAAIAAEPGGVVGPGEEHFVLWSPGDADGARQFLARSWSARTMPEPGAWTAPFAVLDGGRAVGHAVLLHAAGHAAGTVATGSWLARADQGRGLGRRVRLMLLELAFGHLGAVRAVTSAVPDNAASLRVSARCGYRETHRETAADGLVEVHLAVTPGAWRRRRLDDVVVDGTGPLAAAIGVTPAGPSPSPTAARPARRRRR